MKILSVQGRNFQGSDFDYELGAVTLILGGNYMGKTRVAKAIRLALAGSLPPPIGTKGIWCLAGNPDSAGEMSLHLGLEQGRKVDWKWSRDAKGKISVEGGVPPDLAMPPLLLEPRSFFALTGAERIATIFASCPGAGKDLPAKIKTRLNEIQVMPAKVRAAVLEEVTEWVDTMTGSAQLVDRCKVEAKIAADTAKIAAGKVNGFTLPASKPADVAGELEQARQALAQIQVGNQTDRATKQRSLDNVNNVLAAYSRKYQQTPVLSLLDFIGNELATVATDMAKLKPTQPLDDIEEELQTVLEMKGNAANRIEHLTATINALQTEIGDLRVAAHCPKCLSAAKGWQDRAVKTAGAQIANLQAKLATLTTIHTDAGANATSLKGFVIQMRKTESENRLQSQEWADTKTALEADKEAIADAIAARDSLAAELSAAAAPEPNTDLDRRDLKAKIATLQSQQGLRQTYERDMAKREELEAELVTNQARADVLKSVVKLVVDEQQRATETAFSTVLATARHFTDGMLNSPLEFVEGDLGRRVSKLDMARPGFTAPLGSWITHECFSDSEQKLSYVAFACALASLAPIRLIILDELATFQPDKKVIVVDRLIQLVRKNIIDQAICLEPDATAYAGFKNVKEVKFIQLSEKTLLTKRFVLSQI